MVTEHDLVPSRQQRSWILNVYESAASEGVDLRPAIGEYRYGVKCITVIPCEDDEWIKILDGENVLIGPFTGNKNEPIVIEYHVPVQGTEGNALRIQTQNDFTFWAKIEGVTGPPQSSPSASISASVSASPSA